MNNQQTKGDKLASKLINKLALVELELANREVDIDELRDRIQQLTQANQKLVAENQQLNQLSQKDNKD